jgi:hypothetical protein
MFSEEFMYYVDKHSDLLIRLHEEDLKELRDLLNSFASDFNIKRKSTELMLVDEYPQSYMVFFVSKKVEGMSDESLKMYKSHLSRFLRTLCNQWSRLRQMIYVCTCLSAQRKSLTEQ